MIMPLTDLISDQQRENKIMAEELKRNQEMFRALVKVMSLQIRIEGFRMMKAI